MSLYSSTVTSPTTGTVLVTLSTSSLVVAVDLAADTATVIRQEGALQATCLPPVLRKAVASVRSAVAVRETMEPGVDAATALSPRQIAARKAVATRMAGRPVVAAVVRSPEERKEAHRLAGRKAAETRRNNIINQARA